MKKRDRRVFPGAVAIALLLGCATTGTRDNAQTLQQLTRDELDIYRMLIEVEAVEENEAYKSMVFQGWALDSTVVIATPRKTPDPKWYFDVRENLSGDDGLLEALDAYLARDPSTIDWSGLSALGYRVVDRDSMFAAHAQTLRETGRHPATRYISLSAIGFDNRRERAVVGHGWCNAPGTAETTFGVVVKRNGWWTMGNELFSVVE